MPCFFIIIIYVHRACVVYFCSSFFFVSLFVPWIYIRELMCVCMCVYFPTIACTLKKINHSSWIELNVLFNIQFVWRRQLGHDWKTMKKKKKKETHKYTMNTLVFLLRYRSRTIRTAYYYTGNFLTLSCCS